MSPRTSPTSGAGACYQQSLYSQQFVFSVNIRREILQFFYLSIYLSPNKLNKLTKMAVAMSPRTFREASFFIRPLNHSWFILIFYKNKNHSTIAGSFSFFIRTPSVHLLINLYCVLEAYIFQSRVNPKRILPKYPK